MARQHSVAPDNLKTLTFMPGEYLDSLEVVAANSAVGKVQGFFKTPQGFHIIMKTAEKRLSFEQAAPRISQILKNKHLDKLLDKLKTQYEVIIYDKNE
jgi:parvulin-like peptidyl-prolyl isomerase